MNDLSSSKNDNDLTLQSYQDKTQEYVDGTPPIDDVNRAWLDNSLGMIPGKGKILEIGSGFGRDAEYVRQQGFEIECSDAVLNFVELLQKKGFKARLLNVLTQDLGSDYNMILADAVLLHFTPKEAAEVTKKIHIALADKGIFALRMKKGDGPVWSQEKLGEPRYFYYWQIEELKQLITGCGFEWVYMTENHSSQSNTDWMHVIAQKSL